MFIFHHLAVIEFRCAVLYQISSRSGDFLLRFGDLTICNMAAVSHLEFSKFRVYVMRPLSPCYSAFLCKISLKSDDQLLSYGQEMIFKMVAVCHLT